MHGLTRSQVYTQHARSHSQPGIHTVTHTHKHTHKHTSLTHRQPPASIKKAFNQKSIKGHRRFWQMDTPDPLPSSPFASLHHSPPIPRPPPYPPLLLSHCASSTLPQWPAASMPPSSTPLFFYPPDLHAIGHLSHSSSAALPAALVAPGRRLPARPLRQLCQGQCPPGAWSGLGAPPPASAAACP